MHYDSSLITPSRGFRTRVDRSAPLAEPATAPLVAGLRASTWIWGFICLGLLARVVRYALRFPLWEDETFLSMSVMDRGYGDLLRPLDFHQVAPLLFMWAQLTMVKLFGFTELSLRLVGFLASVGSLFLFRHVASRLLQGPALVIAVAAFAVSYPGIRYAAEAKQYGTDLLVSLALLAMVVEWWREPARHRWLWILAAFTPLAMGLSYPAAFVGGGISLVIAYGLWTSGDRRGWFPWVAYNVALLGSFGLFYWLAAAGQSAAELEFMEGCWGDFYPPLTQPLKLIGWFFMVHAGNLLAIPVGGERGASTLSFVVCVVGLIGLVRARRYPMILLCLAPLAINLVAAAMHRYPYGGHPKFAQYLAPAICMLLGLGGSTIIAWVARRGTPTPLLRCAFALLALVALGSMVRDFRHPYKSPTDLRYRDFARWFWWTAEYDGEAVCLKTDLGLPLSKEAFYALNWSAMYLCNQRIYSPRHARGEAPRWDRVTAQHPLRCVQFWVPRCDYNQAGFDRWMADMQSRYKLLSTDRYAFPCLGKNDGLLENLDYVLVYKFGPKETVGSRQDAEGSEKQVRR